MSLRLVLFEPAHPNNIGAAARAMKTMGIESLYLVHPKFFPSPAANALASTGVDILDRAIVTQTLQAALMDCQLILATSGRDHVMNFPILEVREAALKAHQAEAKGLQVAIVFGTEATGLSNDQLKLCHYHVRIPTSDVFSSLNLAQAVQVMCYELLMAKAQKNAETTSLPLATHTDTERFYTRLEALLRRVDFLKPGHDKIILQKLRRLFQRAQLETNEVIILQGIISNIEHRLK